MTCHKVVEFLLPRVMAALAIRVVAEIVACFVMLFHYDVKGDMEHFFTLVLTMSVSYTALYCARSLWTGRWFSPWRLIFVSALHMAVNMSPIYLGLGGVTDFVTTFCVLTSLVSVAFIILLIAGPCLGPDGPRALFEKHNDEMTSNTDVEEVMWRLSAFLEIVRLSVELNAGMQVGIAASGELSKWGYLLGCMTLAWIPIGMLVLAMFVTAMCCCGASAGERMMLWLYRVTVILVCGAHVIVGAMPLYGGYSTPAVSALCYFSVGVSIVLAFVVPFQIK